MPDKNDVYTKHMQWLDMDFASFAPTKAVYN